MAKNVYSVCFRLTVSDGCRPGSTSGRHSALWSRTILFEKYQSDRHSIVVSTIATAFLTLTIHIFYPLLTTVTYQMFW